jgi:hypothetical protein
VPRQVRERPDQKGEIGPVTIIVRRLPRCRRGGRSAAEAGSRGGGAMDLMPVVLPLWAMALVLLALAVAAKETGRWIARRYRADRAAEAKATAESYVIGPIFGLLALMVGFTFSVALNRYDARRQWIAEEANAIGTAYLRADLLDEPHRARLQGLLRDYAKLRIAPSGTWDDRTEALLARSEVLRTQLWEETRRAVYPVRETNLAFYTVEAMNNTLDISTRRVLAGRAHVPTRVIDVLILYLIVAAAALGYVTSDHPGARKASNLLLLLFVLAMSIILDIDRPRQGSIQVSQRVLEELVASMDADARAQAAPPPAAH